VADTVYYFSIYKDREHIQIKWERQIQENISTSHLNDVAFLLEKNKRLNWDLVCKAINGIIEYDRVTVLQVHENGHSNVLAEDRSDHVQPLKDMEFSPVFMWRSWVQYYGRISYSYLPDIDAEHQYLISEEGVAGYTSV